MLCAGTADSQGACRLGSVPYPDLRRMYMPSVMDDVPDYSRWSSQPQLPSGWRPGVELAAGEKHMRERAHERVTEASYDLFRALRAGDMTAARWLVDGVHVQVSALCDAAQAE